MCETDEPRKVSDKPACLPQPGGAVWSAREPSVPQQFPLARYPVRALRAPWHPGPFRHFGTLCLVWTAWACQGPPYPPWVGGPCGPQPISPLSDFQSQPFPLSADGHGAAFSVPPYWRAAVFLRGLPPLAFRGFPPFRLRRGRSASFPP